VEKTHQISIPGKEVQIARFRVRRKGNGAWMTEVLHFLLYKTGSENFIFCFETNGFIMKKFYDDFVANFVVNL